MKQTIYLALFSLALLSCTEEDAVAPELIGTWQLSAILADPGDGSGTFNFVDSGKTMTFLSSGLIESNESLCPLQTTGSGRATYSLQDSTIVPICSNQEFESKIWFKVEGSNLVLTYQCIEACAEKYVKR